jgi:anti-sigma factor RsiW
MTQGCARRRDNLAAFALSALDSEERAAMKQHLADCPACNAYYQDLAPPAARPLGPHRDAVGAG